MSVPPAVHVVSPLGATMPLPPPPPKPLLRGVNLCVMPGGALLVRGAAGAGKTALMRTVCGLWPMGEAIPPPPPPPSRTAEAAATDAAAAAATAELTCVPPLWNAHARRAGCPLYLVLPQSAPLRPGMHTSLYEQLVYPLVLEPASVDHGAAVEALATVGLGDLPDKLGGLHVALSPREWLSALSPGQRQLLICARIFVHLPALVLLDEATSAMPAADEARIYAKLRAHGIAYISIGHRTSLEQHHDTFLDL